MRSFILVAVVLQLAAIITHSTGYQFGDIVAFPRKCFSTDKKSDILYGVYVGGSDAPNVGQKEKDIFYLSAGFFQDKCDFGKLREIRDNKQELLFKDLDTVEGLQKKSNKEMAEKIRELKGNCKKFDITRHNSEHVATLVHYGERISLQLGGKLERLGPERSDLPPEIRQKLEKIQCERIKK